jgi:putative oxidoreductase
MVQKIESNSIEDLVMLLSRLGLAALFIIGGFEKIFTISGFAAIMASHGLPFASLSPYVAIVIELVGGIVFLLGYQTRLIAILFAIYTIVTALIGHNFWAIADAAASHGNQIHFFKNVSIAGGFLAVYVTGGGRFSVDGRLRNRS